MKTYEKLNPLTTEYERYQSMSYDVQCIVDNILDRFEDCDRHDNDTLIDCLNDELIYYTDMWSIVEYYCLPQDCNWEEAIEQFLDDLTLIAQSIFEFEDISLL